MIFRAVFKVYKSRTRTIPFLLPCLRPLCKVSLLKINDAKMMRIFPKDLYVHLGLCTLSKSLASPDLRISYIEQYILCLSLVYYSKVYP